MRTSECMKMAEEYDRECSVCMSMLEENHGACRSAYDMQNVYESVGGIQ